MLNNDTLSSCDTSKPDIGLIHLQVTVTTKRYVK